MRVFVALDIDDTVRDAIALFLDGMRGFAPEARWVRPESLHVTLKFIGEHSEEKVEEIKRALENVQASSFELHVRGYGFFPGARAPRVFWTGIEGGSQLTTLAKMVDDKLALIEIPKEEHAFNPHLTLARGGSGSGAPRRLHSDEANRSFQLLQEKLAALPPVDFGTIAAREFFLYQSQLPSGGSKQRGAKYTKLAGFRLQ